MSNIKLSINIFFLALLCLFFNCGTITDGIIESTHDEVSKIGAKEVFILTFNQDDGLYYHSNEYGTYKFSGKNYIKFGNGKVKEKSEFKKGKKHGNWFWYNKQARKVKKQVWDEGKLLTEELY